MQKIDWQQPADRLRRAFSDLGKPLPEAPIPIADDLRERGIERLGIIVTPGRAGSTWLSEALRGLDNFGTPLEFFAEDVIARRFQASGARDFRSYFLSTVEATRTGPLFSFKTTPVRLMALLSVVDLNPLLSPDQSFWIDLRRRDLIAQAHSMAKAVATGVWHQIDGATTGRIIEQGQEASLEDVRLDDLMSDMLINVLHAERHADLLFTERQITPFSLWYEELTTNFQNVIARLSFEIDGTVLSPEQVPTSRTAKLATEDEAAFQLAYMAKRPELIAQIYRQRSSIDFPALRKSLLGR